VSLTALSLYNSPDIFSVNLTQGQREALQWVRTHVPVGSNLIIDDDIWVDLREGPAGAPSFANAHSHWKASLDPAIWIDYFDDNWRKVDYMVLTPGLDKVFAADKRFPWQVYSKSQAVARFGTGDAMVEIRKVAYPGLSTRSAMSETWEGFKQRFVSEGQVKVGDAPVRADQQASALLMAVWMDDRTTFDQLWEWAKLHLRDDRGLFYGTSGGDGSPGAGLTVADTDAAMALTLAANRWQEQRYATDARDIARALWQHYVVMIDGKPYLAAGDWAITPEQVIFAPGAFSPAAYHLFAGVDPDDKWWYLLDSSYDLLARVSSDPLGETHSAGLPPAYVGIDRTTGALIANPKGAPNGANSFNLTAAEVYWRVALDLRLHNDGRATSFLRGSNLLGDEWRRKGELAAAYSHAGPPTNKEQNDALYSAVLPKLTVENPSFAESVYATKIAPRYSQNDSYAVWGDGANIDEYRIDWIANALYGRALNDDWSNKAVAPYVEPVFDDWRTDPNFNTTPPESVVPAKPAVEEGAK
jgi:endoglucanase